MTTMTTSATTDTAKTGAKLQTKRLGTGGKIAIGVAIAGVAAHVLTNNDSQKRKDEHVATSNTSVHTSTGNHYDAQIAANISGYGYGKRVGGFM